NPVEVKPFGMDRPQSSSKLPNRVKRVGTVSWLSASTADSRFSASSRASAAADRKHGSAATRPESFMSFHADEGHIEEPRLRRYETLDLRGHGTGIEIMDDKKPWRIINEALVRLCKGLGNHFWVRGFRKGLERGIEFRVLPLLKIEAVW